MPIPVLQLNSPALVIRKYLISTGVVIDKPPTGLPDWIVYAHKLSADGTPNNAVGVMNTSPIEGPRDMHSGEKFFHEGIQIMVRSSTQEAGYLKCKAIQLWLSEHLKNTDVTMGATAVVRLHAFTITTGVTYVGEEEKLLRHFHSLNGIVAMTETVVTP